MWEHAQSQHCSPRRVLVFRRFERNKISNNGVRALAEALERCPRVRHVYVHAGNKIEALGTEMTSEEQDEEEEEEGTTTKTMAVTTICAVDARNNNPEVSKDVDMEKEMKRDLNRRRFREMRAVRSVRI